jgi:lipoate-protein ligase A
MIDCRLLRHGTARGAWNMAVDEMLLEQVQHQVAAVLRFYRWNEPTLSLGYFQTYSQRADHPPSMSCAAVRRLTGGGAIVHDDELTYSIVLHRDHPRAARRDELYRAVHDGLIEALGQHGVIARLALPGDKIESAREPFLCFQRRSPGDVLIGQAKVCGSAQRRRAGAVLQHGSLLWRASSAAPELPGVADLTNHPLDLESLLAAWLGGLGRRLDFGLRADELDEKEVRLAGTLVESRFACDDWTRNRCRTAFRSQESL